MGNTEVYKGKEGVAGQARSDQPTLLVVDDDRAVAGVLHEALTIWGYDVVLAANGQEGLAVLAAHHVDGIVLDIHMPVMGGRAMLDELRWLGYPTPVVMMSGGSDESTLRQLAKEDAQGFLNKPFSLQAVQKLCARVFEHHGVGVSSRDHSQGLNSGSEVKGEQPKRRDMAVLG